MSPLAYSVLVVKKELDRGIKFYRLSKYTNVGQNLMYYVTIYVAHESADDSIVTWRFTGLQLSFGVPTV